VVSCYRVELPVVFGAQKTWTVEINISDMTILSTMEILRLHAPGSSDEYWAAARAAALWAKKDL